MFAFIRQEIEKRYKERKDETLRMTYIRPDTNQECCNYVKLL